MKAMKSVTKGFITMLIMVAAFCVTGMTTNATEVMQTNQTNNSVTISWPAEEDAIEYYVSIVKDGETSQTSSRITVPAATTSYTFTGLQAGTEYRVSVEYKYQGYISSYTGYVGITYVKTKPVKVSGVKQDRWWYYVKSVDIS